MGQEMISFRESRSPFLWPVILCLYLSSWSGLLLGQQFNFHNYSISDGLAQSQVYSLLKDSRGYLWLGTNGGGLSRFDGSGFHNYSRKDGLSGSYVFALQEDKDGNLWIGTDKGVCVYDGVKFKTYALDSLESQVIIALTIDQKGNIWLGTVAGLYLFDGKSFNNQNALFPKNIPNRRVNCLFSDKKDNLWIGLDNQIICLGEETTSWGYQNGYTGGKVNAISQDHQENLWLATSRGVFVFDGKTFSRLNTGNGLKSNFVQSLFTDRDHKTWLAYQDKGLSVFNPADSSLTHLSEQEGLCKNDIRCITQDPWGNIWLGSSGGGISKYSGQQFEHFDRNNSLLANRVYALLQDTSENIWVSASNRGFSVLSDSGVIHHGANTDFIDIPVKAMLLDSNGGAWIGTEGKGLVYKNNSSFIFFTETMGLAGNWVKDIIRDPSGNLWIGTNAGISKAKVTRDSLGLSIDFQNFDAKAGLPRPYTNDLLTDKHGRIWAALRFGGLACIEQDSIKFILDRSHGLFTESIRSLAEDSSGYLWIGTADAGVGRLSLYSDSHDISFLPLDRLYSENIYSLVIDDEQRLWAGSQQGVDCIRFTEDRNLLDVKHYGRAEGFSGIENCTNAVLKDRQGNLWFGTMNGLTKYNAQYTNKDTIPPFLRFTNVALEYTPLRETKFAQIMDNWGRVKGALFLPWNINDITFEFQGTDLSAPQAIQYRWKLEGLDETWSPFSENNTVRYANLAPGQYSFLVKSLNSNEIESSEPITFPFTIQAPFWQKKWFPWTIAGLLLLLLGTVVKKRFNQLKRKSHQKEQQLSMEKKMLELEQKALQLQMNPHFIFNTLNSIQALIGQKDPKQARYYLSKFSRLMRKVLENSRSELIPLSDEMDSLDDYLSLEQFGKDQAFTYEITANPGIATEEVFIPPLLIQPFVENALVHGLASSGKNGRITILFEQNQDQLLCTVADNGIGRAAASRQKSQRESHHKSMGLQVTAERLNLLNKNIRDGFIIEDIINQDGSPGGTKVLIKVTI